MTDAAWSATPSSNNYNLASNWVGNVVPDGTATFGASTEPAPSITAPNTFVGTWSFAAGAPAYSFTVTASSFIVFDGGGILANGANVTLTNNAPFTGTQKGVFFNAASSAGSATILNNGFLGFFGTSTAATANITSGDQIQFAQASSAGDATINSTGDINFFNTSNGGTSSITLNPNGSCSFWDKSSAFNAEINNNSGTFLSFNEFATAGNSSITNNATLDFFDKSTAGDATIANAHVLSFSGTSSAGTATILNEETLTFSSTARAGAAEITNDGLAIFQSKSSAGSATITTQDGGRVDFLGKSTAAAARFITDLGGIVDFSSTKGALGKHTISAGSIDGAGDYILGANKLTVGGNNLSTEVSGHISGVKGGLVKVGVGVLTLSGENTYTGGTVLKKGVLDLAALDAAGTGAISFAKGAQKLVIEDVALESRQQDQVIRQGRCVRLCRSCLRSRRHGKIQQEVRHPQRHQRWHHRHTEANQPGRHEIHGRRRRQWAHQGHRQAGGA